MRIILFLSILLLVFYTNTNSQTILSTDNTSRKSFQRGLQNQLLPTSFKTNADRPEKCGFAYLMNKARAKGFNDQAYESHFRKLIERKIAEGANKQQAIVTVPVIFHVVYRTGQVEGGTVNLAQLRITEQIQQLNNDYANLSGSAYGVAADVQIRFCAALVDQYGRTLTQPGIDRINGQTNGWANTAAMSLGQFVDFCNTTVKPTTIWDPYSYVNVWTLSNNSGLLGFATFPGFSTLPGLDNAETDLTAGIVVIAGTVGSTTVNGTLAPYNFGRTLTHESGHFFGLRHIWGDENCGEDYCADTPTQDEETAGCPASPQPNNCTPAANKMFENYMDYSNDACLNTFTANQGLRATAAMGNSPRRITLASSAACQARPGNAIQFGVLGQGVTETGTTGTCPRIKTIVLNIGVAAAATGASTVTFNLGGSATNNADYTISPASVSYTNGDNALKPVTITLIDDNSIESAETIQLSYTISGAGVVAGPDKQVCTITIGDDDFERIVNNSGTINLLTQNFNGSTNIPVGWDQLTLGTNGWVVSANGGTGTTVNAAHITQDAGTKPNTYDEDVASEAYLVTPLIDATGLANVSIAFNWRCIGEVFGGESFDEGRIGFIPENDPTSVFLFNVTFNDQVGPDPAAELFNANLPASFNNTRFYIVFYWTNDDNSGEDPGFTIDDVVINGQGLSIESTQNDAAVTSQNTGQAAQYITPDNQIIARLSGLNENVGCITATVQNSGNGTTTLTTATGSYLRSNKVIRLQPAAANTTASYQVTLYYTTAELAAWGGSVGTLKMLKVRDGVNLAGTITSADAQISNTTVDDQRAISGYAAFTSSFTNGFSQFMLVSPATTLPVNLLAFEAKAADRSIILNWSTSQEINNKGFGIERSADGINYKNIGWINGKINSNDRSDYSYTDNFVQPGITYQYRLRQTDIDAREKLSVIRQARIDKSGIVISISPNPAKGKVALFVSGSKGPADVNLVNAQGQVVRSWKKLNAIDAPASLDISGLTGGVYVVSIQLQEEKRVEKLVVE